MNSKVTRTQPLVPKQACRSPPPVPTSSPDLAAALPAAAPWLEVEPELAPEQTGAQSVDAPPCMPALSPMPPEVDEEPAPNIPIRLTALGFFAMQEAPGPHAPQVEEDLSKLHCAADPPRPWRFSRGDAVWCQVSGRWHEGVVVHKRWRMNHWPEGRWAAYQLLADLCGPDPALIYCPRDCHEAIRHCGKVSRRIQELQDDLDAWVLRAEMHFE